MFMFSHRCSQNRAWINGNAEIQLRLIRAASEKDFLKIKTFLFIATNVRLFRWLFKFLTIVDVRLPSTTTTSNNGPVDR